MDVEEGGGGLTCRFLVMLAGWLGESIADDAPFNTSVPYPSEAPPFELGGDGDLLLLENIIKSRVN